MRRAPAGRDARGETARVSKQRLPHRMRQRYRRIVANFTKILAATDFSEDSTLALGYAEELARRFGAEMLLLHVDQALPPVMSSPEIGPVMDIGAMTRIAEEQRMSAHHELDKIVNRLRDSGLKARSLLKVGSPFLEIIHTAKGENADLIVMGTHGRTGIVHVLMGSVAERVVQKAHCPVLTIRHPDRKFKHPLDK
jgi:nucleotide-binding universal stress UspA family protein